MPSESRPEVLALLGDSKSHPEQEGLRLILADWLEEHGDPADQARAEMIRCQIDHARLPPEAAGKAAAGRRGLWLQQKFGPAWLGPVQQWLQDWSCPRGLLAVSVPVASLKGQAMSLLAGTETWAWVEEVYLHGGVDADVARLRRCALLEQVGGLGFRRFELGPAGARSLAAWPLLERLHRLDLRQTPLGDPGLAALAASRLLGNLRFLDLSGCRLEADGLASLAGASLPRLQLLMLGGNSLGDAGLVALARARPLPRLRHLHLRGNQIGDAGGVRLAGWPGLAEVRELGLEDNHLGSATAIALARSPYLECIESLLLWGNPIGREGAQRLTERFGARVRVSGTQ